MDKILGINKAIVGLIAPIAGILVLRGVVPQDEAGFWTEILTVGVPGVITAFIVWLIPNKVLPMLLIGILALPLGACGVFDSAGAVREVVNVDNGEIVDWGPQNYSGINVLVTRVPLTDGSEVILERYDGKEAQSLDVFFKNANGTEITYSATGVKAFEGQKYRAELETAIAEQWPEIVPEIRGGIVDLAVTIAEAITGL